MILRTTKLEQMIAECDAAELHENCSAVNTSFEVSSDSDTATDTFKHVNIQDNNSATVSSNAESNDVSNVVTETVHTDSEADEINENAESAVLHNFKLMFNYRVAETVNTLEYTQYFDGAEYILYNGASCFIGKERIFEDLATHTELPDAFLQRRVLFDNKSLQSIGNVHDIYKSVKSTYKTGVKRYNELNKKNGYRGDELKALYMFSAWFNWQPEHSPYAFAYNAARVYYALEYMGIENILEAGVVIHTAGNVDIPVLRIRTMDSTFYLMPRRIPPV